MRTITCQHCDESMQIPDDLTRPHCIRCGQVVHQETNIAASMPSAGKPGAFKNSEKGYLDWDEFRMTSPAVRRIWMDLAMRPPSDIEDRLKIPLPPDLPTSTDEFGRLLGSIRIRGENRVVIWIIAIAIFFSTTLYSAFLIREQANDQARELGIIVLFASVFVIGSGIFSYAILYLRRVEYTVTYWVFEEGLAWQRRRQVKACGWDQVRSMEENYERGYMRVHLELASDFREWLWTAPREPWSPALVHYLVTKITEAQLMSRLRRVFEGERVPFGIIELDRLGLSTLGFRVRWSDLARVGADSAQIIIEGKSQTIWRSVRLRDVAFPHVMLTLCAVLIEESGRLPEIGKPGNFA